MRRFAAALLALLLLGGSVEAQDGLPLPAGRFREVQLRIYGKKFRELRLSRGQVSDDDARDLAALVSGISNTDLPELERATARFSLLYFTQSVRPIRVDGRLEETAAGVAVPADPAYDAVRPLLSSLVDRIAKSEAAKAKEVEKALEGTLTGVIRSTNLGLTLSHADGSVYHLKNKGDASLTKLLQGFVGFPVSIRGEISQGAFGDPKKRTASVQSVVGIADGRDVGTTDGRVFIDITGLSLVGGQRYVRVAGGSIAIGDDMTPGLYAPGDPTDVGFRVIGRWCFPEDSKPATTQGLAKVVERVIR